MSFQLEWSKVSWKYYKTHTKFEWMNCFQRNRNDIQGMNEITQRLLQYLQKKTKKKKRKSEWQNGSSFTTTNRRKISLVNMHWVFLKNSSMNILSGVFTVLCARNANILLLCSGIERKFISYYKIHDKRNWYTYSKYILVRGFFSCLV